MDWSTWAAEARTSRRFALASASSGGSFRSASEIRRGQHAPTCSTTRALRESCQIAFEQNTRVARASSCCGSSGVGAASASPHLNSTKDASWKECCLSCSNAFSATAYREGTNSSPKLGTFHAAAAARTTRPVPQPISKKQSSARRVALSSISALKRLAHPAAVS